MYNVVELGGRAAASMCGAGRAAGARCVPPAVLADMTRRSRAPLLALAFLAVLFTGRYATLCIQLK